MTNKTLFTVTSLNVILGQGLNVIKRLNEIQFSLRKRWIFWVAWTMHCLWLCLNFRLFISKLIYSSLKFAWVLLTISKRIILLILFKLLTVSIDLTIDKIYFFFFIFLKYIIEFFLFSSFFRKFFNIFYLNFYLFDQSYSQAIE